MVRKKFMITKEKLGEKCSDETISLPQCKSYPNIYSNCNSFVASTEVVFHIFLLLFVAYDWLKVNHLNQAEQKEESGFLNILSPHNSLRGDNLQLWNEVKMARKELVLFHSKSKQWHPAALTK